MSDKGKEISQKTNIRIKKRVFFKKRKNDLNAFTIFLCNNILELLELLYNPCRSKFQCLKVIIYRKDKPTEK